MTELDGRAIEGVLFDKDGTLLDFHETWDEAVGATLRELTTDAVALEEAARAVGYDLARGRVELDSPIIAESNATIIGLLDPWLDTSDFEPRLMRHAVTSAQPAVGAGALLDKLKAASIAVGLVTNDSEEVAWKQLAHLGWERRFAAVVGYDSGFGAKPDPEPVVAGVELLGVSVAAAAMVGDSPHDLWAAHRAGVIAVYVGAEGAGEGADVIVADLVELASLID